MRILVTGGAGFIGKHLCRRLRDEGHEVTVFDCHPDWKNRVDQCFQESMCLASVENGIAWFSLTPPKGERHVWLKNGDWDRVYHLACHASPSRYQRDPIDTASVCFNGTRSALQFCTHQTKCRILLTSTSEIYGEPEVHPQPESYRGNVNCLGPRACYDEGKRMAECLMMDYHRQHGVNTRIARIFNTYGPGMDFDDGRVISNFITQAIKGEPLTIYGDGSQTRSFCYIDDMVEGLIRLMEYEGPECHEPCNLGNPEESEIVDIAVYVESEVDPTWLLREDPMPRNWLPLPTDDPTRRCPDITRAKRNLGWEPKVGLAEGLARTVADFRERMQLEKLQVEACPKG